MMNENSYAKFDTKTPKSVFVLKRRSNQRNDQLKNIVGQAATQVQHK